MLFGNRCPECPEGEPSPVTCPSQRDRLLLAFADLGSYGIYARPCVPGSGTEAHQTVSAEATRRVPFASTDYAFWRKDDEQTAFDDLGALIGPLPLHVGNPLLVAPIRQVLLAAGLPEPQRQLESQSLYGIFVGE